MLNITQLFNDTVGFGSIISVSSTYITGSDTLSLLLLFFAFVFIAFVLKLPEELVFLSVSGILIVFASVDIVFNYIIFFYAVVFGYIVFRLLFPSR